MAIPVKILSPGGQLPRKAYTGDAGWDLMASAASTLPPGGEPVKVGTGIAMEIPPHLFGWIADRSSMGSKGVTVLGGVIDPDYRGEIVVVLLNVTPRPIEIAAGDKIAQLLILPKAPLQFQEVAALSLSPRNVKGFGSSGL